MRRLLPLLIAIALPVWAQQDRPADLKPLPAIPPPPPEMSSWDQALEPQVTIKKTDREEQEEYRVNGQLYMIKVTPAGGPTYYLIDQQGNGSFTRVETLTPNVRPPMWVIYRF